MIACVEMLLESVGKKADPAIKAKYGAMADAAGGLEFTQGVEMLKEHGVNAAWRRIEGNTLAQLTSRGSPVVTSMGPPQAKVRHAVVVDGITWKPAIGKVAAVRDPLGGSKYFWRYGGTGTSFFRRWNFEAIVLK